MRNRLILLFVVVAVILTVVYALPNKDNSDKKAVVTKCKGEVAIKEGYCAPDFSVSSLTGEKVELYKNNGKPTYINFWASWCGPCQSEMPAINAMYEKKKDEINFIVLNATMSDDEEDARGFVAEHKLTMPIYLDLPMKGKESVASKYGIQGLPTHLVVDPNGKITFLKAGEMSEAELLRLMKQVTGS